MHHQPKLLSCSCGCGASRHSTILPDRHTRKAGLVLSAVSGKNTEEYHPREEVLDRLDKIKLNNNDLPERYPLFAVKNNQWEDDKPTVLVTGGVHGYETSGVQGSLLFLKLRQHKSTYLLLRASVLGHTST